MSGYVELHARSAFSFLRGASHPEALAEQAAHLGMPALALCDRDGVYGAVRLFSAARSQGIRAIVGAELSLDDGSVVPVLVENADGYRNLCRLITRARLRGTKKHAPVQRDELAEFAGGLVALTGDGEGPVRRALATGDREGARRAAEALVQAFGRDRVFVEVQRHLRRGEERELDLLAGLAEAMRLPLLATNGVCYATRAGRPLLDVLTCIRNHTHLDAAGRLLAFNSERCLKPAAAMQQLFRDRPQAVENTVRLAERLTFTLDTPGYEFPRFPVPEGDSMDSVLRRETMAGARRRYGRLTRRHRDQLRRELDLICRLGFSGYFLIVWDLVNFCREQNILVQGRGSAANSAVCYCLGITACDPIANELLFERFLSEGRTTWPDIDLDLPSGDRRERVIQEVYRRYGREGAAMTANVITYRGRSAMREIGKALHFPEEVLNRFSNLFGHGDYPDTLELREHLRQAGLPAGHPRIDCAAELYRQLYGLPRHLGQHSGGMIISQGALSSVVPLENASMPGRVVAQWDKDDCADVGIIKVDLLGLGMMSVLQDSIGLCRERNRPVDLAHLPMDDPAVYDLMCRADTIGVFQIESRAQMATLPRMQPRRFYDLVVEVAIIRPGPIQGEMLHPFLARRAGLEPVTYFHPELEPVLKRTLGVPLFQEQLLKMAMVMADFNGSEAEELRRALSYHRSPERMAKVCERMHAAMLRKGVSPETADQITKAVQSFAVYGFPESHAISFALISYASCWLKVHRPAEFYCALLNNQPMGFYSSATLVRDGRARGLKFRPVSVLESDWLCTVPDDRSVRLGLCCVRGLREEDGRRILRERETSPFRSLEDFQIRTRLPRAALRTLAKTGALNGLADHRRDALWKVESPRECGDLFACVSSGAGSPLERMTPQERLQADYSGTGLSTGMHPMLLIRHRIPRVCPAAALGTRRNGSQVTIGGLVICRQRPGTAKGYVFVSLEDETGIANAILTPDVFERFRPVVTLEPFLLISGRLQIAGGVIHVKGSRIRPLRESFEAFGRLPESHDFH